MTEKKAAHWVLVGEEPLNLSNPVDKTRYDMLMARQQQASISENEATLAKRKTEEAGGAGLTAIQVKNAMPGSITIGHSTGDNEDRFTERMAFNNIQKRDQNKK